MALQQGPLEDTALGQFDDAERQATTSLETECWDTDSGAKCATRQTELQEFFK